HASGFDAIRVDKKVDVLPTTQPMTAPSTTEPEPAPINFADTDISNAQSVEQIIDKISNTDLSALGWIGLLLVIYSAISLMVTIENSFNAVYGAPRGRAWI